jgi:hypothetical protein
MQPFDPLDYLLGLTFPARVCASHWLEHIPFALAVVEMTRPRVLVELGVFSGASYCAFCQAIAQLGLSCTAFGVDTWKGDPHNGTNGIEVLDELRGHHDPLYGSFSRLVPATFDCALEHFADASIDLLHIDGYHTYEAVKHDFENWLPKMSTHGVILFHDINVREMDFGVWRLWEELKPLYRTFEFTHQHGLGVLALGPECPEPVLRLTEVPEEQRATIRQFYYQLGRRITHRRERDVTETRRVEELAARQQFHAEEVAKVEATYTALIRDNHARHDAELGKEQVARLELQERLAEVEQLARVHQLQLLEKEQLVEALHVHLSDAERQAAEQAQRALQAVHTAESHARQRQAVEQAAEQAQRQLQAVHAAELHARSQDMAARLEALLTQHRNESQRAAAELAARQSELQRAQAERTAHRKAVEQAEAELARHRNELQRVETELAAIHHSLAVRLTRPVATLVRKLAPQGSLRRRVLRLGRRSISVLRREGVVAFTRKVWNKLHRAA